MDEQLLKGLAVLAANPQALNAMLASQSVDALNTALNNIQKLDVLPDAVKATMNQSGSATSGFTAYDLEAPGKLLYPVLTPLRNAIPRVSGKGGIQAAWRAITAINTTNVSPWVSEGNRNGVMAVAFTDYTAAYKGLGMESNATFEAQYAGENFDDLRKRASQTGLHALMLKEEYAILGANGSLALGTTPTPSVSASTTGGALSAATYSVICVALTFDGYMAFSPAAPATNIVQQTVRANADGSSDTINNGVAGKSSAATGIVASGSTGSLTVTVNPVRGAMGYAWYWGTSGNEVLGAVTTAPRIVITATAAGTQNASALAAGDYSVNSLAFDGLLSQALKTGSGAYYTDLRGAGLTADGTGGIVEIDALLKDRWDNYRLNPEIMWVSSREAQSITQAVLTGKTNGALNFFQNVKDGVSAGGQVVTTYLNKFGMNGPTTVQIRQHPNMVPGTILFTQGTLPYQLADVPNVFQIRTRQDYYMIEWPYRSRKYEYGVYADEVLQCYFPPAMGVITGI